LAPLSSEPHEKRQTALWRSAAFRVTTVEKKQTLLSTPAAFMPQRQYRAVHALAGIARPELPLSDFQSHK